jgi:hypothetical protein
MSLLLSYKPLLEVKVIHHFWLDRGKTKFQIPENFTSIEPWHVPEGYDIANFLRILPDNATASRLKGLGMVFRQTPHGFSIYCRKDNNSPDKPFIEPDLSDKLTFFVYLKDPRFYNYTALPFPSRQFPFIHSATESPLSLSGHSILYFSNRKPPPFNGKVKNDEHAPSLSVPLPDYQNNITYLPGNVVTHDNKTYFTREKTTGTAPDAATEKWQEYTPASPGIANQSDLAPLAPESFLLENPYDEEAIVRLLPLYNDPGGNVYDNNKPLINKTLLPADDSQEMEDHTILINTDSFPAGCYLIQIENTVSGEIRAGRCYFAGELREQNFLGITEFFFNSGLNSYNLLNGSGEFPDSTPVFTIRFKNRYTHWRYLHGDQSSFPDESNPLVAFNPLTFRGTVDVTQNGSNGKRLPNPNANMIKPENDRYYSEIFIDKP